MDTTTLVLANSLLFTLYAGVMLIHARLVGAARGALWFAGSSLIRGTSMLLVGVQWFQIIPARYAGAFSAVLAVVGTLMLHQAFAELLERGRLMRRVQIALVAAMVVGALTLLMVPKLEFLLGLLLCGTLSVQFLMIALIVVRFSGEEVGPVGWLTALALGSYSIVLMIRAIASLPWGARLFGDTSNIIPLWLMACLVTSAATAFGYKTLSTAQLRVELLWRAQVDELTGLLNRWALKRLTMREIARCRREKCSLAVVMIDLDGLKQVNDTTGHACGDVVLQAVASVLQEAVREHDAVARMGGDEFCVLLPKTSLEEALKLAECLRAEVEDLTIQFRGETVRTKASLGVATSDICGLTWQALMDASDSALYSAKRAGRNRIVVARTEGSFVLVPADKTTAVLTERENALN